MYCVLCFPEKVNGSFWPCGLADWQLADVRDFSTLLAGTDFVRRRLIGIRLQKIECVNFFVILPLLV